VPTFEDVRRLGARFPEVEGAPSYRGMPALKVRGRPFCRLWSPREHERDGVDGTEVLVVFCDLDEKEVLIESSGGVLFSTPHYEGYPALLVRLADVELSLLAELLEDSYRSRAPKRLLAELDHDPAPAPGPESRR
jgi:hypothetical protein